MSDEGRPVATESWDEHYRDERDAAFLYREMARYEPAADRRELFEKLASVEDRHVSKWEQLFREAGRALPAHRPALRSRALAWMSKTFGSALVLPLMLA
ncbi:hypothetical protein BH18ACI5_BH18ACI5_18190 [soil metagenome]